MQLTATGTDRPISHQHSKTQVVCDGCHAVCQVGPSFLSILPGQRQPHDQHPDIYCRIIVRLQSDCIKGPRCRHFNPWR